MAHAKREKSTKDEAISEGLLKKKISRRSFLKTTAAGSAAVGVGLTLAPLSRAKSAQSLLGQNALDASASTPLSAQYSSDISFTVNGKPYSITVQNNRTLAEVLRIQLGLTGAKVGCNRGECGACTVIINGRTHYSCTTLAPDANGKTITTVEGLVVNGQPDPIQTAWVENEALQCGYCTPGFIMSAKNALNKYGSTITQDQIVTELGGNICRCAAYQGMIPAVLQAAKAQQA